MGNLFSVSVFTNNWDLFLSGAIVSLLLSLAAIVLSLIVGGVICALTMSRVRALSIIGRTMVELARNLPLLVFLYLAYFGTSELGVPLSAFACAALAIGFQSGGYNAEIFRGALDSISEGQRAAAMAVGLRPLKRLMYVEMPQMLRIAFPALGNIIVGTILGTALAGAITVPELTLQSQVVGAKTYQYFAVFAIDAGIYILIVQLFVNAWHRLDKALFGRWAS